MKKMKNSAFEKSANFECTIHQFSKIYEEAYNRGWNDALKQVDKLINEKQSNEDNKGKQ